MNDNLREFLLTFLSNNEEKTQVRKYKFYWIESYRFNTQRKIVIDWDIL